MATPRRRLEPAGRRFLAATDGMDPAVHAAEVARALTVDAGGTLRHLTVGVGLPGVEIVREAEAWEAYLLVLGRRELLPGDPLPLGVTSDVVIRRRNGLTLLVPPHVRVIRRATIALDGSPRGGGIAAPATEFLNLIGAVGHAVFVLPGQPDHAANTMDPRIIWVNALIERLPLRSGPCDLAVRWGDPVAEILRRVRETASDLLVLGVRRGGQRGDSGSGYIGRELLRSAPCAVLTVPI